MGKRIIDELKMDYKESMLEKDSLRVGLIQMVRGNIQDFMRDNKITEANLKEDDLHAIIAKELKQQKDSLDAFEKGGREDLANETKIKIIILESYLPDQLTEAEIEIMVNEELEDLGIEIFTNKQRGMLMKSLMPKLKGRADGKLVSKVIGGLLE